MYSKQVIENGEFCQLISFLLFLLSDTLVHGLEFSIVRVGFPVSVNTNLENLPEIRPMKCYQEIFSPNRLAVNSDHYAYILSIISLNKYEK